LIKEIEKYIDAQKINEIEKNELKNDIIKSVDNHEDGKEKITNEQEKQLYLDNKKKQLIKIVDTHVEVIHSKLMQNKLISVVDSVVNSGYITTTDKGYIREYFLHKVVKDAVESDKEKIKNFGENERKSYINEIRKHLEKLHGKILEYIRIHSNDEIARKTGTCINKTTLEFVLGKIRWNYK
jgi:hypothetical protein